MAVIGPYAVVYADHRDTEWSDMDDVVIVRIEAATGRMSDQLQAIHVSVDGKSRRSEHIL